MTMDLLNIGTWARSDFQVLGTWGTSKNVRTHSRVSQEEVINKFMKEIKKKHEMNRDKKNVSIPETERWECVPT